jgi:O-antigen chain-terminating methyltransferase
VSDPDPSPLQRYSPRAAERAAAPAPAGAPAAGTGTPGATGGADAGGGPERPPLLPPRAEPPLLKRIERSVTALFKLGRTETMAKRATRALQRLEPELHRLLALHDRLNAASARIDEAHRKGDAAHDEIGRLAHRLDDLHHRLETEVEALRAARTESALALQLLARRLDARDRADRAAAAPAGSAADREPAPDADLQHFLDRFYNRLEGACRGAEEEIADRLRVYLPDMERAAARTGGLPVMDLGCGRGEWLSLLRDAGIDGTGVDTNAVQLESATAAGLDVRQDDALAALEARPEASLSAVTAHHLVEHLPFETVARITRAAHRALAPGGVLLYETPDTANVLVGATTFHTDPTHRKPMPGPVLQALLETAGFEPVERRRLNPHERLGEFVAREGFDTELAHLLFGPQDLAVLGVKPGGPGDGHGDARRESAGDAARVEGAAGDDGGGA